MRLITGLNVGLDMISVRAVNFSTADHPCTRKILDLHSGPHDDCYVDLGPLSSVVGKNDCPVCRVLAHLLALHQVIELFEQRKKDWKNAPCIAMLPGLSEYDGASRTELDPWTHHRKDHVWNLEVEYVGSGEADSDESLRKLLDGSNHMFTIQPGIEERSKVNPAEKFFYRKHSTTDGTVNAVFLMRWFTDFIRLHNACSIRDRSNADRNTLVGSPLRLIDVESMCVTHHKETKPYTALSYVWGTQRSWTVATRENIHMLERPWSLSNFPIAQVILDALEIVRRLGQRFLWVDSLCIIQDDEADKAQQLSRMGHIYESADLVLAAAHGNEANAGLPGLRAWEYPLRCSRRREYLNDNIRLVTHQRNGSNIIPWQNTWWNSRGWTYQEGYLARRLLIFTSSQVYLACICGKASSEDLALDAYHFGSGQASIDHYLRSGDVSTSAYTGRNCSWDLWAGAISEYTIRSLTYTGDVLDGISAIMLNLQTEYRTDVVFGMPRYKVSEALLWQFRDRSQIFQAQRTNVLVSLRRNEATMTVRIPSWSWAGWTGTPRSIYGHYHAEEAGRCDRVDHDFTEPWGLRDHPIHHTIVEETPWTAYLEIGCRESKEQAEKRDSTPMYPILSAHGKIIGHIDIPLCEYWLAPSDQPRGHCQFVEMGGRRLRYLEWDYKNDQAVEGYDRQHVKIIDVMLISQTGGGMSQRVGVTYVHSEDWENERLMRHAHSFGMNRYNISP